MVPAEFAGSYSDDFTGLGRGYAHYPILVRPAGRPDPSQLLAPAHGLGRSGPRDHGAGDRRGGHDHAGSGAGSDSQPEAPPDHGNNDTTIGASGAVCWQCQSEAPRAYVVPATPCARHANPALNITNFSGSMASR